MNNIIRKYLLRFCYNLRSKVNFRSKQKNLSTSYTWQQPKNIPNRKYFKSTPKNSKKVYLLIVFLITLFLIFYIYSIFEKRFKPISLTLAQSQANNHITFLINETVNEYLESGELDYSNIYKISTNESGEISSLTANIIGINKIKSLLTRQILDKINNIDAGTIYIPIGNLLKNDLLASRGFKIPIKLLSTGSLEVSFTDNFVSAGINQTKHEILLNIIGRVIVILPTGNTQTEVNVTLPAAQTIIVGRVPDVYTNVDLNREEVKSILDLTDNLDNVDSLDLT